MISKYDKELGQKIEIVLIGGMTKCVGLLERLNKEMSEKNVNITVDEFLLWKSLVKDVNKKST